MRPSARRPHIVAALLAVVLAAVSVWGWRVHDQSAHGADRWSAVQAELRSSTTLLARTQAEIDALSAHRASSRAALVGAGAALSADEGRLAQAEAGLSVAGVSAPALDDCLGGVRVALNRVALDDPAAARQELDGVAPSCAVVVAQAEVN